MLNFCGVKMKKEEIDIIVKYIESSFIDGNLKEQLTNYRRLITILGDESISLATAEKLIKSSKKLKTMLKTINDSADITELLDYENFYTLILAYLKMNKLDTDILDFANPSVVMLSKKDEDNIKYFFDDLNLIDKLSPEEEKAISIRATNGDMEARKKLVEAYIRLAVAIAKNNHNHSTNISLNDLIQEGCLGLIKATEKYDYRKGYKFGTYASWWVIQTIKRYILNNSRTIRIPVYLGSIYNRVLKYKTKIRKTYGYYPSDETVAEELNIPLHLIKKASNITTPLSLDCPIKSEDGGDDLKIMDAIPCDVDQYELVDQKLEAELLRKYIDESQLRESEKIVLIHKFGLDGNEPMKNTHLGEKLGISHERIRQITEESLRILSKDNNIRALRDLEPVPELKRRNQGRYKSKVKNS